MQTFPLPFPTEIIDFRQKLHQNPELSGKEHNTAKLVKAFIEKYHPDHISTDVGGTGIVVIFNGALTSEGPTVLFRAELDALPIEDINDLTYKSVNAGVGHKCGHDGHMAVLAGLASLLHQQRPTRGRVLLLFQPAEETGAGAWAVLQDERFLELQPDFVFALHNIPGVPEHDVVIRNDVFAAASSGMVIKLEGKSSHAAEPEKGNNPALAVAEIIQAFNELLQQKDQYEDLTLLTLIHAKIGEVAFGTNPGFATLMATLRAFQPADFEKLKQQAIQTADQIAAKWGLQISIRFVEEFPATVNDDACVDLVQQAAHELNLPVSEAAVPFRWSEDFGHFTARYKGALFGLGSGLKQPQLHHPDYDFPDTLLPSGAHLFYKISKLILNK